MLQASVQTVTMSYCSLFCKFKNVYYQLEHISVFSPKQHLNVMTILVYFGSSSTRYSANHHNHCPSGGG